MTPARIQSLVAAFGRLSAREQLLAFLSTVAGLLTIAILLGFVVGRAIDNRERLVQDKRAKLAEILSLRGAYQQKIAEQEQLHRSLKQNNVRLFSYLEDIAKKEGLEIGNMQERGGELSGSDKVKENAVELTLQRVSIDRLTDFLGKLESGNAFVKVRRLRVRSRFDDKTLLDATITVGTFVAAQG